MSIFLSVANNQHIEPAVIDPLLKFISGQFAEQLTEITIWSVITRVLLAFIFAGAIGLERASKKHAAGLRTYILVCIGSAMVTMANQYMTEMTGYADAARLGLGVVQGVGFLGAGTILITSRNQIKGLTTAAGLWAIACLGICIGCGFYTIALLGFAIIFMCLKLLPNFERKFAKNKSTMEIHIEFEERANLKSFVKYVREKKLSIASVEHNSAYSNSGLSVYTIVIDFTKDNQYKLHQDFLHEIANLNYVDFVEEI